MELLSSFWNFEFEIFGKLRNLFSKVGGKLWRCEGYIDAKRQGWKTKLFDVKRGGLKTNKGDEGDWTVDGTEGASSTRPDKHMGDKDDEDKKPFTTPRTNSSNKHQQRAQDA